MISRLRVLLITLITLAHFVVTVFLELIATMLTYYTLTQMGPSTFGPLVSFGGDVLSMFSDYFQYFFPDAANQANATFLGELSPKAMLLLLIGLTIGALIRIVSWCVKCIVKREVTLG